MTSQRKGYLTDKRTNYELDQVYLETNNIGFPSGTVINGDYTATIKDRRLYLEQLSLTITLPTPKVGADGYTLFIQDRTGSAGANNHTILPNTGKKINGATSASITTNYGFTIVQWDEDLDTWFKVG